MTELDETKFCLPLRVVRLLCEVGRLAVRCKKKSINDNVCVCVGVCVCDGGAWEKQM